MKLIVLAILLRLFKTSTASNELTMEMKNMFCSNEPTAKVKAFTHTKGEFYKLCIEQPHEKKLLFVSATFNQKFKYPFMVYFSERDDCPISESISDDVIFPENEYLYLVLRDNHWTVGGFAQVWLNCPAPICLMAEIDAAFATLFALFVARAKHICRIDLPNSSNELIHVSKNWYHIRNQCVESQVAFFDYAVRSHEEVYFIKDKHLYRYSKQGEFLDNIASPLFRIQWNKTINLNVDNAFSNFVTSFYLTDKHMLMISNNDLESSAAYDEIFRNVDSAFYIDLRNTLYFIKKDIVYSMKLDWTQKWIYKDEKTREVNFTKMGPVYTQLFDCEKLYEQTFFKNFDGFEEYRNRFTRENAKASKTSSSLVVPIIISLVLIASIAFVGYRIYGEYSKFTNETLYTENVSISGKKSLNKEVERSAKSGGKRKKKNTPDAREQKAAK